MSHLRPFHAIIDLQFQKWTSCHDISSYCDIKLHYISHVMTALTSMFFFHTWETQFGSWSRKLVGGSITTNRSWFPEEPSETRQRNGRHQVQLAWLAPDCNTSMPYLHSGVNYVRYNQLFFHSLLSFTLGSNSAWIYQQALFFDHLQDLIS